MRNFKQNDKTFFAQANQGPNLTFSKILSDHAYQSSCFKILDEDKNLIPNGVINIGTWNLMNKCFSKATDEQRKNERNEPNQQIEEKIKAKLDYIERYRKRKNLKSTESDDEIKKVKTEIEKLRNTNATINPENLITNNPYNIDETIDEYETRKILQMKQIIANIQNGDQIICLQEVDFLVTKPSRIYELIVKEKSHMLTNAEQMAFDKIKPLEHEQASLYACQLKLRKTFAEMLEKLNYSIITTNDISANQDGARQQRFATIYDNKRFAFKTCCGALPTDPATPSETKEIRGFEIYLLDKKLHQNLCVTNIHLTFGKDYNEDIKKYQQTMQDKGIFHVMAGDTNNLQCVQYKTALGKWDDATNFEGHLNNQNKLIDVSTFHEGTKKQKAYDRFFVVAPENHYVTIKSNDHNMKFVVSEISGKIKLQYTDSKHVAITGLGTPYQRGVDELTELYQKILKANTKSYSKVLDSMVEAIERKGINPETINKVVTDQDINYDLYEKLGKNHNKNNTNF